MKIGIDARLLTGDNSGIGAYTNRLVNSLGILDQKNRYILYTDKKHVVDLPENFSIRLIPQRNRNLWTNFYLPKVLSDDGIDLFHGVANFEVPLRAKCKIIVSILDLIPLLYPKLVPFKHRILFRFLIKKAANKSKKILTISHSSKKDIIELLGINQGKVVVVYIASHTKYRPISDKNVLIQIKEKFRIPGRYILFVGLIEPKKNIHTLIKAFGLLKKNEDLEDVKLVIAGSKGWFYEKVFKTVRQLGLDKEVIFTGFVSEKDLCCLYNGAEIFVFPSLYEGFGLPPLEAMSCGTPVICSNVSSLPEVVGNDAAILIDPMDLNGWTESMSKVLNDSSLRSKMIDKGLEQAKLFSWKKTAKETLKIYEEVFRG